MARSRRSKPARMFQKRQRADWVYRPDMVDDTGALIDQMGTYDSTVKLQTTGVANSTLSWLYDSVNRLKVLGAIGGAGFVQVPRAARAEGRNPLCLAAEISLILQPQTWAVGDQYRLGIRLMHAEQDPDDGLPLFNAEYTMWEPAAAGTPRAAIFANERTFIREWRTAAQFNDNSQLWVFRRFVRFRRALPPERGLGIFLQMPNTSSVNLNVQFWCRTLVVDEG